MGSHTWVVVPKVEGEQLSWHPGSPAWGSAQEVQVDSIGPQSQAPSPSPPRPCVAIWGLVLEGVPTARLC